MLPIILKSDCQRRLTRDDGKVKEKEKIEKGLCAMVALHGDREVAGGGGA